MNTIKLNSISLNGNSLNSVGGVSKNKLKKNEFVAVYDVSTTTEETLLFGDSFTKSNIEYLYIDNILTPPTSKYKFNSLGLHIVKGKIVDNVTSLSDLFCLCKNLKEVNLSKVDTSNVTTMKRVFYSCHILEVLNIFGWKTTNVGSFYSMFNQCVKLKQIDVSWFDTSNAVDMNSMFNNMQSVVNINVSGFKTSKVQVFNYMFNNCNKLKKLDISSFDAQNGNVSNMFDYLIALTDFNPFRNWARRNLNIEHPLITPIAVHQLIERSASIADGAEQRILTLNPTTKSNWMASEYYEEDEITRISKGIEIA